MSKKIKNKKKKIQYKRTLKELWSFVRNYKLIFFSVITTSLIVNALYLADSFIFKEFVKKIELYLQGDLLYDAFISALWLILIIYVSYNIFKIVIQWLDIHLFNRFENYLMVDVRKKYFSHIVNLDHQFHSDHKTGSLISRLARAAGAMEGFFDSIIYNFFPFIIRIAIFIPAFMQVGLREGILLVAFILLFLIYSYFFIERFNKKNKLKNKYNDAENAIVSDVFTNIDSVKYFAKENYTVRLYNKALNKVGKQQLRAWEVWKIVSAGQSLLVVTFVVFLFALSIRRFLNGEIMLADIVFMNVILLSLLSPLHNFHGAIRHITAALVNMQDLFEYGEQQNRIKDKPGANPLVVTKGIIEFNNIKFEYPDDKRSVFQKLSLSIGAGETVALVGKSGCGKSTLVKLLYRFHDLNDGKILIDNQNIADITKLSLRENMSIVPQEAILFDDTIFNNIKFSRPEARNDEVWGAIKFAELGSFIKSLKKKEKTIVGERGIKLSGGQKQRVSIARAILANRKILLLDEATSALDTETEMKIQKSLDYLMKNRTSIVIAHRLSTIMRADKIVVMKKGKIVQMGKHEELLSQEGEYKKLWDLQKSNL